MTVYEIVKKMGLKDYTKRYKNVYGNRVDTKYSLDVLPHLTVKDVYIDFLLQIAEITILQPVEE